MATNPTPCVPTLHSFSTPCLTKPADVGIYLIGFLFANPGGVSAFNEGEMMSYRKLIATYGNRPDTLAERIGDMLTTSMRHYFPDSDYTAVCQIEDKVGYGDDGAYLGNKVITININDKDGVAIVRRCSITVNEDGSSFTINYNGQEKVS